MVFILSHFPRRTSFSRAPKEQPMTPLSTNKKIKLFFLLLTIISGIIALWPYQDFQYWISQGDHGRDLYAFKKTMQGSVPYRDYFWVFGPIMPYYYSLFFKIFGLHIHSILLAQNILILAVGILIFLTASIFLPGLLSYVVALWYWAFRGLDFFYTYNHIGAVVAMVASFYCLFLYVNKPRLKYVVWGCLSLLAVMLIRFNVGVVCLMAFSLGLLFADVIMKNPLARRNRLSHAAWAIGTLALAVIIYILFFWKLPSHIFFQSFPFKKDMRTDIAPSIFVALDWLFSYAVQFSTSTLPRVFFSGVVLLSGAQTVFFLVNRTNPSNDKRKIMTCLLALSLYLLLPLHEFILSGTFYRLCWIFPFTLIGCFFIIHHGIRSLSPSIKLLISMVLFFLSANSLLNDSIVLWTTKKPWHSLNLNGERIYTNQTPDWFFTVEKTTEFIRANVPPGQKIFALPFDPLYYFLTDRDSASRQLIFFEHTKIPPEQEQGVINDLIRHNVQYIVLSNRMASPYEGLGTLGKDYCPMLYQYIVSNYDVLLTVGPQGTSPGWAWNHEVKILKRKTLLR